MIWLSQGQTPSMMSTNLNGVSCAGGDWYPYFSSGRFEMSTPRETLCSNVLNLNTPPVLSGIVTENTPLFKRRSRGAIFGHNFFSEAYIALDRFSASLEKQVGWWNWLILLRSHCRNIILSNFRSDKTNSQIIEVNSQDLKENDKNNKTTASKAEALLLYYHLAKAFSCQVKYLEKI